VTRYQIPQVLRTNVPCAIKYFTGKVDVGVTQYVSAPDTLAVTLIGSDSGEPIAKVSVNIPDSPPQPGCIWAKTWAENEGIADWLIEVQIAEPTGRLHSATGALEYRLIGLQLADGGRAD
jgi:hypothetical protein